MLLHKTVEHNARVRREAKALTEAGHDVVVVHLPRAAEEAQSASADGYELRSAAPAGRAERLPGGARRALSASRIARVAARERPDAVHAHDAAMLAPGWIAARRRCALLLYDSHELATGVPYHSRSWARMVAGSVERLAPPHRAPCSRSPTGSPRRLQRAVRAAAASRRAPERAGLQPPRRPGRSRTSRNARHRLGAARAPPGGAGGRGRGGETLVRAVRAGSTDAHLVFLGTDGPATRTCCGASLASGSASARARSTSGRACPSPTCSPTRPRPTSASRC